MSICMSVNSSRTVVYTVHSHLVLIPDLPINALPAPVLSSSGPDLCYFTSLSESCHSISPLGFSTGSL